MDCITLPSRAVQVEHRLMGMPTKPQSNPTHRNPIIHAQNGLEVTPCSQTSSGSSKTPNPSLQLSFWPVKPCGNTQQPAHANTRLQGKLKHGVYLKASQKRTGRGVQREAFTINSTCECPLSLLRLPAQQADRLKFVARNCVPGKPPSHRGETPHPFPWPCCARPSS